MQAGACSGLVGEPGGLIVECQIEPCGPTAQQEGNHPPEKNEVFSVLWKAHLPINREAKESGDRPPEDQLEFPLGTGQKLQHLSP